MEKKTFLKDKVANIILNDKSCRLFVVNLVSKALEIEPDIVNQHLELMSDRINTSISSKYSYTDALYENDSSYINIEVNLKENLENEKKNIRYVCNLVLRQVRPGGKDQYKPVYQININNFDTFKKNRFIYRSSMMEEELHIKRGGDITVVDINIDFLRKIDYQKIKEEKEDSLEKMLYFFICNNEEKLDKLYEDSEIMEKVNERLKRIDTNMDELFYYDYDEFIEDLSREEGRKEGKKEGIKEERYKIAKKLLNKELSIEDIMECTNLSRKEIESLEVNI